MRNKATLIFTILLLTIFCITAVNAQFYFTRFIQDAGNPGGLNTELDYSTTGWTEIVGPSNTGNFWSPNQMIPFNFEFFDNAVSYFKVSQNGLVTFDTSATLLPDDNEGLPSVNLPDSVVACFWDTVSNNPPTGSNDRIYTKVFGTAPNQQLWIRWHSFEYGSPSVSYAYFALVLEETSNSIYMIDMNYHSGDVTSTVGVQLDNATAVQYSTSNAITFGSGGSSDSDNDYYEFFIPNANDLGVSNVYASSFLGFPGTPLTISAVVGNYGTNAQTGFDITYSVDDGSMSTYNYAGTLNGGETVTVDFPTQWTPADTGIYNISAYTSLAGDEDTANDTTATTSAVVFQQALNFTQDFESYSGNPSTIGWLGANNQPFGMFAPSNSDDGSWTSDDFGNDVALTKSARFNLYSASAYDDDWLITPPIDMTTGGPNNILKFDASVTPYTGSDSTGIPSEDTIYVVVSTDGQTWYRNNIIGTLTAADVILPTGTTYQYDLTAWDAETGLYIGFLAVDDPGPDDRNFYIDNVFVGVVPPVDVALTTFLNTPAYAQPNTVQTMDVVVSNIGGDPVPADTLDLWVNGTMASSYGYDALNSGETDTLNLSYTSSAFGTDMLTAVLRPVPGDVDPLNDTLSTSVDVHFYFEDFETGIVGTPGTLPTGWTNETGDDFDWYVDAGGTGSSGTGPTVDHTTGSASGIYLYTEASTPNNPAKVALVTSPVLDVSTLTNPALTFWYHMAGGSMGDLHVDVYDGTTWHLDVRNPLVGPQQAASEDPWLFGTADLSGYGNSIQLRFRGITGGWASDMAIDDIAVDEAATIPNDIIAKGIQLPAISLMPMTQTSILSAIDFVSTFANQSSDNTGDITLEVYDSSGVVVHTNGDVGVTIPGFGDSTFNYVVNASGANKYETYTAALFASNFVDNNPTNDTSWAFPMTFGEQMGYDQGYWGVNLAYASPGGRTQFANRFDLLDADTLTSVTLALGSGTATDSFSIDLYTNDADTPSVMLSRIFRGTFADAGGPSALVTFEAPDIPLAPGDYWIVFDLDVVNNYPIGADNGAMPPSVFQNHFVMRMPPDSWLPLENSSFGGYTPIIRIGLQETPILTIAEARADNDGDYIPDLLGQTVTLSGIVTTPNFGSATDYIIQDNTAGINLFSFGFENTEAVFNLGDELMVTGEIAIYNGKTEIMPSDASDVIVMSTGNNLPDPQVVTIPDVGEEYESELIRINKLWLADPGQWPSAGSNANVDITDGVDTLTMRIDKETDIDENPAPPGKFYITGVGGQYDSGTPPDGGYQIQPRFYTDFLLIPESDTLFADDFEAYTAGVQLTVQNPVDWTPWSGTPGVNDPYVSNAHAYSGVNSVNVIADDDLVRIHPDYTEGAYKMSFMLYVPTGSGAYFNTLQQWTPAPIWGMQVYFDANGQGNIDGDGANAAPFTYSYDTWMLCEVVVNLEHDWAEFYLDSVLIHGWQWSMGTFGSPGPVQLSANNFYGGGVTAPNYYFDDYAIREVSPYIFEDDFDDYTAGTQLVVQNPNDWELWSGGSGGTEDPFVTDVQSLSSPNSILIVDDVDLVAPLGEKTSGVYSISWQSYIPSGKTGYFGVLSKFYTGNEKGMRCFYQSDGTANFQFEYSGPVVTSFNYTQDAWQEVELVVDLDQDLAEFRHGGAVIYQWQWTRGGAISNQLDIVDFWGAASTDEMYIDDYVYDWADPIVSGIDDQIAGLPTTFDLDQNYPNPFNPTTTIKYQLPKKSDVKIVIFNLLGQKVRTIVDNSIEAGYHQVVWDGMNDYGSRVATGVYFYKMQAADFVKSKKMILMK